MLSVNIQDSTIQLINDMGSLFKSKHERVLNCTKRLHHHSSLFKKKVSPTKFNGKLIQDFWFSKLGLESSLNE